MQRIKHHYCWVKAVSVDAADAGAGSEAGAPVSGGVILGPLTATAVFGALPADAVPPIQAQDLAGAGVELATATTTFRAFIGDDVRQLSAQDLEKATVPLTATAVFRTMGNTPMPPVDAMELHLFTSTLPMRALPNEMFRSAAMPTSGGPQSQLLTDTTPITFMLGQSLPQLTFAGATFMGGWQFEPDPGSAGAPGVALRFMPIVGSKADAMDWRFSESGKAWANGALAVSLLSFAAIGDI